MRTALSGNPKEKLKISYPGIPSLHIRYEQNKLEHFKRLRCFVLQPSKTFQLNLIGSCRDHQTEKEGDPEIVPPRDEVEEEEVEVIEKRSDKVQLSFDQTDLILLQICETRWFPFR